MFENDDNEPIGTITLLSDPIATAKVVLESIMESYVEIGNQFVPEQRFAAMGAALFQAAQDFETAKFDIREYNAN